MQSFWSRFVAVALPLFKSDARGRAVGSLALLICLLLGINGLNVVNSYVGRDFISAIAERQPGRFHLMAWLWVSVFAASTIVQVVARYLEESLGVFWREWLTSRFLGRYLHNRVYHQLAQREDIDNPDQRISEDVKTFTATTLSFLILLLNAILTLLAFTGVLWSISPWLFLIAVLYALAGSLGTLLLGRKLIGLDNRQLQKEANFRYALGRLREHAASIAQLKGEGEEKVRLGQRLADLIENFRAIIIVNRRVGFYVTGYNYLTQLIPALVVAPLYMEGSVPFGTVTQSAMAFTQVLGAFSLIITQFQSVSSYAAVVQRLGALWEATDPESPQVKDPPLGEGVPSVSPTSSSENPKEHKDHQEHPERVVQTQALADSGAGELPVPANHLAADEQRVVYRHLTLHTPGDHLYLARPV